MKSRLQRLILSMYFSLIATTISRLIIHISALSIFISLYALNLLLSLRFFSLPPSDHILVVFWGSLCLNVFTFLPQVFCCPCYGSDCQLWDSSLGSGEDRQRHSARDPSLRSHRLSCSYRSHTHMQTSSYYLSHFFRCQSYIISYLTSSCWLSFTHIIIFLFLTFDTLLFINEPGSGKFPFACLLTTLLALSSSHLDLDA